MEIRDKQNFILGCENGAPAWKELISRHHPLAALRLAVNEMQIVLVALAQHRASLGWGTLHRRSTEDRAAAVPTAEDVHPIGRFAPHRGVALALPRRRPAGGDFWPRRRLPTIVAENGVLDPGLADVHIGSNCQKPYKIPYKDWVLRKKHGIKSCIACHTLHFAFGCWTLDLGWVKCIEVWCPILSTESSTSTHFKFGRTIFSKTPSQEPSPTSFKPKIISLQIVENLDSSRGRPQHK